MLKPKQMNKNILEIKRLVGELNCMGTYGLVELELTKIESKLKEKDKIIEEMQNFMKPITKNWEEDDEVWDKFIPTKEPKEEKSCVNCQWNDNDNYCLQPNQMCENNDGWKPKTK
jgi:hypothetical protein